MRILSDNYVKTATITALTEAVGYEFNTALKDTRLSRIARTIDLTSQTIVFDLGSAKAIDYFAIIKHNLTSSAIIHIQGNASDVWTAPTVDVTVTWTVNNIIYNWSSAQTYRYWRITISDATNTDTFISMSKVYLGGYVQLPNMGKSQKLNVSSTSDVAESVSGQSYGDPGYFYLSGDVTFPIIEDSEKLTIETLFRLTDKYTPVILLIWENDLTIQPPIYSRITNDMMFTRIDGMVGRKWSLNFSFKEVF